MSTSDPNIIKIQAWLEANSQKIAITIAHYLQDKTHPVELPKIRLGRVVHQPKKNSTPKDWLYTGYRDEKQLCVVRRKNTERTPYGKRAGGSQRLSVRQDIYNHGNGFEWGYSGSGPAQLALAILVQYLQSEVKDPDWKDKALRWHQQFKVDWIAPLPREERWFITREQMQGFVDGMNETESKSGINR